MNQATGTGKTVEKAIEDALLQLKQSRDNVDIKILETGGLFKKAQVLVTLSDEYLETQKAKAPKEQPKPTPKVEKEIKVEAKAEPKIEKIVKEEPKKVVKEQKPTEHVNHAEGQNEAELGKQFLQDFLKAVSMEGTVEVSEEDDEIFYTVNGEKVSNLIGYRGECLNSLQFLITVINGKNNRKNKHVRLDIDGYREKRKETLENLAKRMALKVQKTGHAARLEPMTAYERRIIHTTIQEFEGLTSVSRGEEPHRYLIIKKDDDKQE